MRRVMKMKITPAKDYKKPLYAVGIAASLMAVTDAGIVMLLSGEPVKACDPICLRDPGS